MKFGIISAGEGSRLAQEGIRYPKPLVPLNGVAMIDRLIGVFERCGATSIAVIVNNESLAVREHLEALRTKVPLEVVVKTTPSSMHSFYELSSLLKEDKFCLTTVDTVFREEEFVRYIEAFRNSDADGLMAVTDFVDDEKPLYVSVKEDYHIDGFTDEPVSGCQYVSGGIYCLKPAVFKTLVQCMEEGMSRMRNFQRRLVYDGYNLSAYPFRKILDVDHAGDISKAELFLSGRD